MDKVMDKKLFIPILLGTNRQGRTSEHAAKLILSELEKRENVRTLLMDARDFQLPHDNYGEEIKDQFPEYKKNIIAANGLIIVSPEYNHGYPGILKSILDLLFKEYENKPVAVAGVSMGLFGGARMIENLAPVLRALNMFVTNKDLQFIKARELFDERGEILDESYLKRTNEFLDAIIDKAEKYHQIYPPNHGK